jgi:hypothetical protein
MKSMCDPRWRRSVGAGLILGLLGCCRASFALDASLPPGGNFDLTHWYLGLPVDSSGGTTGDSASISAAQLVAGYSNALYFYTGPDGAMTFWAPVTGATTPGSSYPRSELREQIFPPSNDLNWRAYGTHILDAQCRVKQVPSTKKVIIGQIHTKTGDARPLVKVYASDTMPNTDNKLTFQNVGLNNPVSYVIRMENGLATVTVNGLSKSTNVFLTDPDWANQEFYFKAGSYCQDNSGTSSEGSRVAFYLLSRSHAPSITNQPVSVAAPVGSPVAFSVEAAGNGALQYQWRRDGTNLGGATASVLNLPNVQLSQAGGYSVRVTDSLGAVTSVVATLTVTNAATNTPPTFTSDPIIKPNATVAVPYSGSLAGDVTDPDAGEILTFNKVSGPGWLSVAGDGTLSGTPAAGDVGTNSWTVSVTDLASASNQASLNIIVSAAPSGGMVTNVIVDDRWPSGTRTSPPNDASYWSSTSSSGNSIEVYADELGLISGTSGRGIHGVFASQPLAVNETLTSTYTFTTPATVGMNKSSALRLGLFDTTGHLPGLQADLTSSSTSPNAVYNNLSGYMIDFDVGTGSEDISLRERSNPASGQLLATTDDYTSLGGGGSAYSFAPNTTYTVEFSVTRQGTNEVWLIGSLYQGTNLLSTHTEFDSSATATEFGMLAIHANSSTFGSTTTAGQGVDNGITFSNIKVEVITPAPASPPTLDIALAGSNVVLNWPTSGTSDFQLEATLSMSAPAWSGTGSPTAIGATNYVTNSLTGDAKFYRLKK